MELLDRLKLNAKKLNKKIVLPEGYEERTLKAADICIAEKIASIILIGNPDEIHRDAEKFGLKNLREATIVDPKNHEKKEHYINLMVELRKHKGLTREEASRLIEDPLYLGVMMIKNGDADGEVSGADHATSDVLRPALQFIKTAPGVSIVSGAFIIVLPDKNFGENGVLFYADSGVNPNPNERELAEIAITSARSARQLCGYEPRIAMLSFSTKGSASHPMVDKVVNATRIAKEMAPELMIDGELQGDAALVESVGRKKAPGSPVAGKANVLIFPDLNAGNISYKLTERLAHAIALGPILQGIASPVNDLSRGCSVNDIVDIIAITANQAAN
ncbi:MAG TPA: phosphate acetyltransferase [Bacteroidales bacterium]|nr:phosphate acetyltransferase [Bacteroidales bacterium]HCI55420.1 phosphate acetyltransferase [Bacteroidales bacterium]HOU95657.1 phosphate acetyltransferase [Bacteroidales bacterium]HQG36018.1 phosphate acetyltransferase [Bacteroidales bacterium]HQG53176.1 phosphate acetyltransferase [Bacteroidales bacterium]